LSVIVKTVLTERHKLPRTVRGGSKIKFATKQNGKTTQTEQQGVSN